MSEADVHRLVLEEIEALPREGVRLVVPTLEKIFHDINFDKELIKQYGVLSCEIEYGREYYGLKEYQPKISIMTEPPGPFEREDAIKIALEKIAEDPKVRIVREHAASSLRWAKKNGYTPALITWFSMYPPHTTKSIVHDFLQLSSELLPSGGAVVMSMVENTIDRRTFMQKMIDEGPHSLDFSLSQRISSIGELFLVGKKK